MSWNYIAAQIELPVLPLISWTLECPIVTVRQAWILHHMLDDLVLLPYFSVSYLEIGGYEHVMAESCKSCCWRAGFREQVWHIGVANLACSTLARAAPFQPWNRLEHSSYSTRGIRHTPRLMGALVVVTWDIVAEWAARQLVLPFELGNRLM